MIMWLNEYGCEIDGDEGHLFLGTKLDNSTDMRIKGRSTARGRTSEEQRTRERERGRMRRASRRIGGAA